MAHKRILSFKYAGEGILAAIKEEPNLIIHLVIGLLVLIFGAILGVKLWEWVALILVIGFVLVIEFTNTAIEAVVDSFTSDTHPGAKKAKDIAAGAVLVASITAAIIGLLIFLPYLG